MPFAGCAIVGRRISPSQLVKDLVAFLSAFHSIQLTNGLFALFYVHFVKESLDSGKGEDKFSLLLTQTS